MPDLLLDAARRRAVAGLRGCLRKTRWRGDEQCYVDDSANGEVLQMHMASSWALIPLDRWSSGRKSPEAGTHSVTEAKRSASQLRLVGDSAAVPATP